MSADRIGEECPECGAFALREFYTIGPFQDGHGWALSAKYSFVCRECDAEAEHEWPTVPLFTAQRYNKNA